MAEHVFESARVEEFYNAYHSRDDGRFTFAKGGKRGKIHVPFSEGARRSYALLKRLSADRKTKDYKTAKARVNDTWANREVGQGGLRGLKGNNSKKADAARAANAIKGAKTVKTKKLVAKHSNVIKFKNDAENQPGPSAAILALTKKYGGRS